MESHDVIIAGGGAVGLLLANLLGQRGVRTLVMERRAAPEARSMAIGITPPSLAILNTVGLDAECVRRGVPVRRVAVHDRRRLLGDLDFDGLPGLYPFILCLPQAVTLEILEAGARRFPSVTLMRGVEIVGFEQDAQRVRVRVRGWDVDAGALTGRFLVGSDGHDSAVRGLAGIGIRTKRLGQTFLMADFDDDGALGQDAHLFFTETGAVEAFPLPDGRRRWIVMTDAYMREPPGDFMAALVRVRSGIDLAGRSKQFESPFRVSQFVCARYFRGRVVLCGDAAHVMSPIGGQGMNIGFGDAAYLSDVLGKVLGGGVLGAEVERQLREYDRVRRKAFHASARLATRGMWLGTRRGRVASWLRGQFIARVLLGRTMRRWVARKFGMVGQ